MLDDSIAPAHDNASTNRDKIPKKVRWLQKEVRRSLLHSSDGNFGCPNHNRAATNRSGPAEESVLIFRQKFGRLSHVCPSCGWLDVYERRPLSMRYSEGKGHAKHNRTTLNSEAGDRTSTHNGSTQLGGRRCITRRIHENVSNSLRWPAVADDDRIAADRH